MKRKNLPLQILLVFVLGLGPAAAGIAGPGGKPAGAVRQRGGVPTQRSGRNGSEETNAAAATPEVTIDNFSFSPQTLTVPAGTTVTWTNRDDVPHTVVSEDGKFRSHALDTDDKFSYTFAQPGSYAYYCSVHPRMTAKVLVTGGKM
jgi:plastocyanin